jgi:LPXTG-motif cell wall-anchored protein
VKRIDDLALTGQPWFWLLIVLAAAAVGGGGWLYLRHRRIASDSGDSDGSADASGTDHLAGISA